MSYFEMEGVRRQDEATTAVQAKRQFEHSCELCAMRGRATKCDQGCKIQQAHFDALRRIRILMEMRNEQYRQAYSPRFGVITQVYIRL